MFRTSPSLKSRSCIFQGLYVSLLISTTFFTTSPLSFGIRTLILAGDRYFSTSRSRPDTTLISESGGSAMTVKLFFIPDAQPEASINAQTRTRYFFMSSSRAKDSANTSMIAQKPGIVPRFSRQFYFKFLFRIAEEKPLPHHLHLEHIIFLFEEKDEFHVFHVFYIRIVEGEKDVADLEPCFLRSAVVQQVHDGDLSVLFRKQGIELRGCDPVQRLREDDVVRDVLLNIGIVQNDGILVSVPPERPFRDAGAVREVAAAGDPDHPAVGVLFEELIDGLGHDLVPEYLRLVEEIKAPLPRAPVPVEDLLEPLPVFIVGKIHVRRYFLFLLLRERVQAFLRHLLDDLPADIQGDDRYLLFPAEIDDRLVKIVIKAPALEILPPRQKFPFIDRAGDVIIERLLERPLEQLHAHGELRVLAAQALEDLELDVVVRYPVVIFPDIHDLFPRRAFDHALQGLECGKVDGPRLFSQLHGYPPLRLCDLLRDVPSPVEGQGAVFSIVEYLPDRFNGLFARFRMDDADDLLRIPGILLHDHGKTGVGRFHRAVQPSDQRIVMPQDNKPGRFHVGILHVARFPFNPSPLFERFDDARINIPPVDGQDDDRFFVAEQPGYDRRGLLAPGASRAILGLIEAAPFRQPVQETTQN